MRSVELLVVGAGASGMMAAITAARGGSRVLLLEKKNRTGKKLLATGNGRCNYTNQVQAMTCYRSQCQEKAWDIIKSFDDKKTVAWFREIGVLPGNRQGYLYPASFQAASVLHALEREMKRLKIEIHREEPVEKIEIPRNVKGEGGKGYVVTSSQGKYLAGKVIISTGGMAAPVHGSTGDGYGLVKPFSLAFVPVYPALCALLVDKPYTKKWAGNRVQGRVSLMVDNEMIAEDTGEIQLVAQGISGIPVFQVSRFAAGALAERKQVFLYLDSMPEWDFEMVLEELKRRVQWNPGQSVGDLLEGMLPDKLSGVLIKEAGLDIASPAGKLTQKAIEKLVTVIKEFPIEIHGTVGFDKAQVTRGGISLEEIERYTMEVKKCPGLYLTGELLDVDGICGGYNLQWAWTTGYLAGMAAAGREEVFR